MAVRCACLLIRKETGLIAAAARPFSTTNKQNRDFLVYSPNACLDKSVLLRYNKLQLPEDKVQVTYLWIDGTGAQLRIKDRVLNCIPESVDQVPQWQFDGSSTGQSTGENSDLIINPRAMYKDPFKAGENDVIVMCDVYEPDGKPAQTNRRVELKEAMDQIEEEHDPWFGFEQEYTLLDTQLHPFGWPRNGFPRPQGPYYCGVGANKVYARDLVESHITACLYAGIDFYGTNSEVMPSQWEFQTGPTGGMKAADDLWVARYILKRIAEDLGIVVSFDPKPMVGNWNGAGAHTNFSTKSMRADCGGMKAIEAAIEKLSKQQERHIKAYDPKEGADNMRRLVGEFETSTIEKFSWGIADRGGSVRVPRGVANAGKGYLEDRRPSSNCDPYSVCNALVRTCLIE